MANTRQKLVNNNLLIGENAAADAWGLIGHDWAVGWLRRSLLHRRQRHGYLITGAPSLGKRALALAFARALNCEHDDIAGRPCGLCRACRAIGQASDPDLILAAGEDGAPLKIDAIRDVARLLALKPYAARYRIAIFEDFDLVAPLAQDALLKTLEEPARAGDSDRLGEFGRARLADDPQPRADDSAAPGAAGAD